MGGTGSKQEDQIVTVAIEKQTGGKKFTYVPMPARRCRRAARGKHVDSTVNNPSRRVPVARQPAARLCIFDSKRSTYTAKVTETMAWSDIPTCKESGLPVEYQMLRGIFMPKGATPRRSPIMSTCSRRSWRRRTGRNSHGEGAFNQTFMTGADFEKWVAANENLHRDLMKEAGFLATN